MSVGETRSDNAIREPTSTEVEQFSIDDEESEKRVDERSPVWM